MDRADPSEYLRMTWVVGMVNYCKFTGMIT
jgi:hypothetical protein